MERVVQVDEAVFAGRALSELAEVILEGALQIGAYAGGVMVLEDVKGARVAARGRGGGPQGSVPPGLLTRQARRLAIAEAAPLGPSVGLAPQALFLVPLATPDVHVGTLVLADPDGESPDDRLMEAYASRAAAAWVHAARLDRSHS